MLNDPTYKVSFTFAIILHMVIVFFLFVRFTHTRSAAGLVVSKNIINAFAVNDQDIDNQIGRKTVTAESLPNKEKVVISSQDQEKARPREKVSKAQEKSIANHQLQDVLKKKLLQDRSQELIELKEEKYKYKSNVAKHKEKALQQMLQEQIRAEQKQLADAKQKPEGASRQLEDIKTGNVENEEHGSRLTGNEIDKYSALIKQAISLQWVIPEGTKGGDFCRLRINVAPGGVVLEVKLVASNGNVALDRSAQAAVFKASPLPVPEDMKLFDEMRIIDFTFKPEGIEKY